MIVFYLILLIAKADSFYQMPSNPPYDWIARVVPIATSMTKGIIVPNTNEELKNALCSKYDSRGYCVDYDFKVILLTKVFDFTNTEGTQTEEGCYHLSTPECLLRGQKKLNVNGQCNGLRKVWVTYNKAGITNLKVGSNKYIISRGGGLKGKGLRVMSNYNVFIYGLSITDINSELIFGGDAIQLDNATNVWIHKNYFCRIGRQMIVTGHRACQRITISYNHFDGWTPYAAYCDNHHYWLWLFVGADDTITLYNNYIQHTSGRGAHVTGLPNTKVLLHMIKNTFINVRHSGLVEAYDTTARILIEGNTFNNVSLIVSKNWGRIYYPFTKQNAAFCKRFLNRECYFNNVINSGGLNFRIDDQVLKELVHYHMINTDDIDRFEANLRQSYYSNQKSQSRPQRVSHRHTG